MDNQGKKQAGVPERGTHSEHGGRFGNESYAVVVGGINMDIHGFPKGRLKARDSNIGFVKMSAGGVGRNIADNLSRLGICTKMLGVIGEDSLGRSILSEGSPALDYHHVKVMENESTSIYLAIMDEDHDMSVAVNAMDIMKHLDAAYIDNVAPIIREARLCILDTNPSEEVIERFFQITQSSNQTVFVDAVSTEKAMKLKPHLSEIHTLKLNKLEAEALTGLKIDLTDVVRQDDDLDISACRRVGDILLEQGVQQIFITLGERGVFFADREMRGLTRTPRIEGANSTGAGDAFAAAIVYAYLRGMKIAATARFATAAAIVALSSEKTIHPEMSIVKITEIMEELTYVETVYANK